jgi:hypothetical protein
MEQEEATDAPLGGSMRTGEGAASSVRSTLGHIACGLVFGGSLLWHSFWGVVFFASARGARPGDYLVLAWTVLGLFIGLSMLRAVLVGRRRAFWRLQLIGAVGALAGCIGLLGDESSSPSH